MYLFYSGGQAYRNGVIPRENPIWMVRVGCTGTETDIQNCSFPGWGKSYRTCDDVTDAAGVKCLKGKLILSEINRYHGMDAEIGKKRVF